MKSSDKSNSKEDIFDEVIISSLEGDIDIDKYAELHPSLKDEIKKKNQIIRMMQRGLSEEDWNGKNIGEYVIVKEIGRGGMGITFLALQPALNRFMALKLLPQWLTYENLSVKRFKKEATVIAKLNHQNIVSVFTTGEDKSTFYIAMPYIPGLPLSELIHRLKSISRKQINASLIRDIIKENSLFEKMDMNGISAGQPHTAETRPNSFWSKGYNNFITSLFAEIADAIAYAHKNNICHGDIKPSNIILTPDCKPVILDFGLAVDTSPSSLSSTFKHDMTGTLKYISPEQVTGKPISEKTDMWSLGITFCEALVLKYPFSEETISQTMHDILNREIPSIRKKIKLLPKELEAIISKCVEKNPKNRYGSMTAVKEDIRNFLESKPIKAKPVHMIGRGKKWVKRHRLASALTLGLVIALTIALPLYLNKMIAGFIRKGNYYSILRQQDKALQHYNRAATLIRWLPMQKNLWVTVNNRICAALRSKGQFKEAMAKYENVLTIDPNNVEALMGMASIERAFGSSDESEKLLRRVLDVESNNPSAIKALAEVELYYKGRKGRPDKAIELYKKAVSLQPDNFMLAWDLGDRLFNRGMYAEAIMYYKKALGLGQTKNPSPFLWRVADAYWSQGLYHEAIAYYKEAVALEPNNSRTIFLLARKLTELRQYDEAIAYYERAASLEPQESLHMSLLGDLYLGQGKYDQAITCFKRGIRVALGRPKCALIWRLGDAYYAQGLYDEAIAQYEEAVALDPGDVRLTSKFADVLYDLGQYERSLAYYEKALALEPQNVFLAMSLAKTNYDLELYDEALKWWTQIQELRPKDNIVCFYIGKTLAKKGLLDDAVRTFRKVLELTPQDMITVEQIAWTVQKKKFRTQSEVRKYLHDMDFSEEAISSILKMWR